MDSSSKLLGEVQPCILLGQTRKFSWSFLVIKKSMRRSFFLHSWHAVAFINSLAEAKLQCLLWAINSMSSLNISKVIFGSEANDLMGEATGPKAWPSFAYQVSEINLALSNIPGWRFHSVLLIKVFISLLKCIFWQPCTFLCG